MYEVESEREDSNLRHVPYKDTALPTELHSGSCRYLAARQPIK